MTVYYVPGTGLRHCSKLFTCFNSFNSHSSPYNMDNCHFRGYCLCEHYSSKIGKGPKTKLVWSAPSLEIPFSHLNRGEQDFLAVLPKKQQKSSGDWAPACMGSCRKLYGHLCLGFHYVGEKYNQKGRRRIFFTLKMRSMRNDSITYKNLYCKQEPREKLTVVRAFYELKQVAEGGNGIFSSGDI